MGYYVGADSEAEYQGIRVRNLRKPCAEILAVDTENGKTLKGECLEISNPSRFSLPMLRTNFTCEWQSGKCETVCNCTWNL